MPSLAAQNSNLAAVATAPVEQFRLVERCMRGVKHAEYLEAVGLLILRQWLDHAVLGHGQGLHRNGRFSDACHRKDCTMEDERAEERKSGAD